MCAKRPLDFNLQLYERRAFAFCLAALDKLIHGGGLDVIGIATALSHVDQHVLHVWRQCVVCHSCVIHSPSGWPIQPRRGNATAHTSFPPACIATHSNVAVASTRDGRERPLLDSRRVGFFTWLQRCRYSRSLPRNRKTHSVRRSRAFQYAFLNVGYFKCTGVVDFDMHNTASSAGASAAAHQSMPVPLHRSQFLHRQQDYARA
jgi:hypothetical protein